MEGLEKEFMDSNSNLFDSFIIECYCLIWNGVFSFKGFLYVIYYFIIIILLRLIIIMC